MICAIISQLRLVVHRIWDNGQAAVPAFAAAAKNLTNRDAKLPLLKRYEDLDYACTFLQRLKRFPDHRAEHSAAIGAFHGVARSGRGHKKVAGSDRPVFGRDFARNDPHDSESTSVFL